MINFEEELKKFQPSMEIDQVQSAVYNHDLTDMTDIMLEMMKNKEQQQQPPQQPLTNDFIPN